MKPDRSYYLSSDTIYNGQSCHMLGMFPENPDTFGTASMLGHFQN
jgi:hypothetical protein